MIQSATESRSLLQLIGQVAFDVLKFTQSDQLSYVRLSFDLENRTAMGTRYITCIGFKVILRTNPQLLSCGVRRPTATAPEAIEPCHKVDCKTIKTRREVNRKP